jgi:hypothetical protein
VLEVNDKAKLGVHETNAHSRLAIVSIT